MYQKLNGYTPQISYQASFILRRIAWSHGEPMTKTLNNAILSLIPQLRPSLLCSTCKDHRCSDCPLAQAQLAVSDAHVPPYGG